MEKSIAALYSLCNILTSCILLFYCLVKEFVYVLICPFHAGAAGDHEEGSGGVDGVGGVGGGDAGVGGGGGRLRRHGAAAGGTYAPIAAKISAPSV